MILQPRFKSFKGLITQFGLLSLPIEDMAISCIYTDEALLQSLRYSFEVKLRNIICYYFSLSLFVTFTDLLIFVRVFLCGLSYFPLLAAAR